MVVKPVTVLVIFGLLKVLTNAEILSDHFAVKWRTYNNTITFHIAAKTLGWVAIGFNDKPQMKGADIVVAGLAHNKGYIYVSCGLVFNMFLKCSKVCRLLLESSHLLFT